MLVSSVTRSSCGLEVRQHFSAALSISKVWRLSNQILALGWELRCGGWRCKALTKFPRPTYSFSILYLEPPLAGSWVKCPLQNPLQGSHYAPYTSFRLLGLPPFLTLSCKDLGAAGLATLRRGALVHLPAERGGELGMIFVEVASNLDFCRVFIVGFT